MLCRRVLVVTALLTCSVVASARSKKKVLLPADVLKAETVLVVVDPVAGTDVEAPLANRTAQEDVEKALMKWGRFRLAIDASTADLVITVRRGSGKIGQPTIGGLPNNRPVIFEPTDSGARVGINRGTPQTPGGSGASRPANPSPQVEVGPAEDTFSVFRGGHGNEDPLAFAPVWRYSAKNALQSPDVPAVEKFRKLMIEAEKQLAAKP
jgi:hypothetical protein